MVVVFDVNHGDGDGVSERKGCIDARLRCAVFARRRYL
jgi:hypothetical protein